MARQTVKLPSFSQVSKGAQATLELPRGFTYDSILIRTGSLALDELTNVELLINGKVIQRYESLEQLKELNDYYRRPHKAGGIKWWFIRPEFQTLAEQRLFALGTADVDTCTIRMNIAAAPADGTNVKLEAWAVRSNPSPLGLITKVKAYPVSFATAGQQDIDNIPRWARIGAVHFFKADISHMEMEANSTKIFDAPKSVGEENQEAFARTPLSAKASHIDFCLEGDLAQAFVTQGVSDMRFRPTIDSPGQINVLVEYFDGFAGI